MAKSKKSGKKPKTTRISAKDDETFDKEEEVREEVAEKKEEVKTEKVEKTEKPEVVEEKQEKPVEKTSEKEEKKCEKCKKCSFWKSFFAKKYEEDESVLTIFKQKRIWGAILGEVFGTMFVAMIILTLGLYQPLYMFFILLAVSVATYKLSGAILNPINTVGMMATRRISAIRGVLYLLAQLLGAWLGFLIVSVFINTAAGISGSEAELPGMTMATEGYYWVVTFLEFLGAAIVGFFFARAWENRKNVVAFGAVAAGGLTLAMVVVYLISYQNFGLTGNFMLNPAVALMYQILPTSADGVGELLLEIVKALFTYVLFPVVGGTIGFYLADIAKTTSEQ